MREVKKIYNKRYSFIIIIIGLILAAIANLIDIENLRIISYLTLVVGITYLIKPIHYFK